MRYIWSLCSTRRVRGVAAALVLVAAAVTAVNLDHRTPKQRAEAWAAAHTLPATLEELAAYPESYRQALFNALPPADQSRLWRQQLQRVLDTETDLNAEQRAFISKAMALATPASFIKDMPKPEVCDDIARLFTNPKQKEKIRTIASFATPRRSVKATWVSMTERARATVALNADPIPCTCRGLGLCECGLIMSCITGDCGKTNDCGCIWAGECDKMCEGTVPKMNRVAGSN